MTMKRRIFGLLAGTSVLSLMVDERRAWAQSPDFSTLSKTSLTPLGSERAGNADGSIPAWTGGYTTVPNGWTPQQEMPDFFASDQALVVIDAGNMAQYKDRLTVGVIYMMQNYGYSIKVYPTHRTAAAPQYVYDNIALNATRSAPDPAGLRFGFVNGYGGVPFPLPDTDPKVAGLQIIWNHECRWQGFVQHAVSQGFVVSGGGSPTITTGTAEKYVYPYYDPNGSPETFSGILFKAHVKSFAPATSVGTEVIQWQTTNSSKNPVQTWELLQGQGRVRKTPELQYDTPVIFADGLAGYDEYYGFDDAPNKYDWTLLGKKEMYIPYNNNKMRFVTLEEIAGPKFLNPDIVRWELHRVWVVDAVLRPGERNVLPHRRYYIDEDSWTVALGDCWDANGNIYKEAMTFNCVRPDLPATVRLWSMVYNLGTGDYANLDGSFNDPEYNTPLDFQTPFPAGTFDPNALAAEAAY